MKKLTGMLLLVFLAVGVVWAQTVPDPAAAQHQVSTAPAAHFDVNAATEAYMAELSPAQRASSDAYFEGGYWLILWDLLVGLAVAWLLLGTRLSARMRNLAERITRLRWLQTAIYALQYIVLTSLLMLPWSLYEGYFREHQYGLSNLTLGGWFGEQIKGLIVGLILGTVALVIIYAVIRRATRSWWLWGAGVVIVFSIFVSTIAPVYLMPVFNTYKSLPDSPLKVQILSMARANEIPATDVYWFDASRQSKRISANVSGLFGTTRISLNDNLLKRSSPEEIKAVLGHEMGHYVLNHGYKDIAFSGIIIVFGFAFVQWGFGWAERRWGERWGLRGVGDVAGLPLIALLFSIFMFFLTPVNNTITRTMEAEADAFGLNAARQPDGFAQAAVQLSEYRKMHPGPVEEYLFFDHPSGWQRIHRAMVWKGENLNDPTVRSGDAIAPPGAR
ncbi:M48 family metallopeptidase [Rhodanobacter sp. AS-Z3]|uniref:M48 family metallopeptidase n=1 Tax=Rhodanobacter sp. AS-Z3 TaxID=3031330 RepID=UPI00247AE962|nr:M48 family metallopeptidase [Rhodanobacter sp. AS-Z3]WEN14035.1 M48 family metallopeptidase [Rhodanobacter sp. AS-Z3]